MEVIKLTLDRWDKAMLLLLLLLMMMIEGLKILSLRKFLGHDLSLICLQVKGYGNLNYVSPLF